MDTFFLVFFLNLQNIEFIKRPEYCQYLVSFVQAYGNECRCGNGYRIIICRIIISITIFSVGLATPAAAELGTAAGVMMDGISRVGLGAADFVAETADTCGANVIDGDVLPSSTGGLICAVIDKKNGNAFFDTEKVGQTQKMGEKVNAGFTFLTSTADYVNTAKQQQVL